jgi:hypothetical protein
MTVDIKTCILFIIQDMQENNKLCGRYRACNVTNYDDIDNLTDLCCYNYAGPMAQTALCPNKVICQWWSQHALDKTFNHVPLSDPIHCIVGAQPVETIPAYCNGMIEMVTF